jgi:hypothetical protein
MKPMPHQTVRAIPTQDDILARPILPYDSNMTVRATFLTVALGGESVALPYLSLGKTSLRGEASSIVLEFGRLVVKIEGRKLAGLFQEILTCKVRAIRVGKHPVCTVESIRVCNQVGI